MIQPSLASRVEAFFAALRLPDQSLAMSMATQDLVFDLWEEVKKLEKELKEWQKSQWSTQADFTSINIEPDK